MASQTDTRIRKDRLSDITLVSLAQRGDESGFTELCRRYYPAMVAIADSIMQDRHLAEDAAQQAFATVAIKLRQLRKPGQFAKWLAAICRNAARDMIRSHRCPRQVPMERREPATGAEEAREAVREALRALPVPAREILYLRYYDGLSYEQITTVLGISQQAINGRLRRAKRQLADRLRREGLG